MSKYRFCLLSKNDENENENKNQSICSDSCLPKEEQQKELNETIHNLLKKNSKTIIYSTLYPCSPYLPKFIDLWKTKYNSDNIFKECEKNVDSTWF